MKVYVVLYNEHDYDNPSEMSVADVFFSRESAEKYVADNTYEFCMSWHTVVEKEVKE